LTNSQIKKTDNITSSDADIIATEDELVFAESAKNSENVVKVLQPKKFFSDEAKKDLKPGDTFEICPSASNFT